jgi:ParB/RepB/Spo0J family partition protein
MARKRLSPVPAAAGAPAPETKSAGGAGGGALAARAPIAAVSGGAAAEAALAEVTREVDAARAQGRLAQALPLEAIETDHVVRDRLAPDAGPDDEEMTALIESIRARGQQTPIEVVDLGGGRYGLISGWRRLTALQRLRAETGGFAMVLAVLRAPETAAAAYVAMVEENEIRVGLSYYERARIAARAVEQGVYPDSRAALRGLFSTASRAKRSKIGAFLPIVAALGGVLAFPAALPERLGLALSRRLEAEPAFAATLAARLAAARPATPAAEQTALRAALAADGKGVNGQGMDGRSAAAPAAGPRADAEADMEAGAEPGIEGAGRAAPAPPVRMETRLEAGPGEIVLRGPGVTPAFARALADWLEARA